MIDKIAELHTHKVSEERNELRKRQDIDDVPWLQYLGFSYGTVLGNFSASLFPERISPIVLDGISNAVDYVTGAVISFAT